MGDALAACIYEGLHALLASQQAGAGDGTPAGGTPTNGASSAGDVGGLLGLMSDPAQARRRQELQRLVGSLEQADAKLRTITLPTAH